MSSFITLNPIDPGTDTRVTVRLCSSQNPAHTGQGGEEWWPAIAVPPVIQSRFFDGDFTSSVDAGSSSAGIRLDVLRESGRFPRVERYDWAGADVTIQALIGGTLTTLAVMKVKSFAVEALSLGLRFAASENLSDTDVLTATYAGTTGAEGPADLKGQVKPWVFGRAKNVEPVFIDQIDNVFQVSGYGPVQAISAVYERGASFGASVGNFANYAALVAANIPEGRWGTCLAQGMFRLGAPPAGVITCDVDGDNTGGFLRRTGAILREIGSRIGLPVNISSTSATALDTAVARNVNIVIREQISFLELAQRMAAPCNAVLGVNASGVPIISRVALGSELFTLDAQGREMPPVLGMARQNTSAPYKRIQMGADRSWRVQSFDEIAFYSDLIDLGLYNASTVYREGNIVSRIDKSRWLYIGTTPSAGNAPPTWPTTSNAFWDSLEPPASEDPAVRNSLVMVPGLNTALPAFGDFIGQQITTSDTREVLRWDGTDWAPVADITVEAVRIIEPQFPVIEIKEGEPGNSGTRTVTHSIKRGAATLTGGTWSLPSTNVPGSTITVNSSTGTVSLSGVAISGAYAIRYAHTDGVATDLAVNVTYVPTPPTAVVQAKTGRATSTSGTANNGLWQSIVSLTITGAPAGRASFGVSRLTVDAATGTASFEARLLLDGVQIASVASQSVVTGGVLDFSDWRELFADSAATTAGNRTFAIELRRTSGTGTITTTNTVLEAAIIAT